MDSECSICFEMIRSSGTQFPYVTRCGHMFHEHCIRNALKTQSKCPQCNQNLHPSQLIRLYPNERESSNRAKDELIRQLRSQLAELNEKAQLQYDLIGALNRQISLEKKLRENEEKGRRPPLHQHFDTGASTSRRSVIIAPSVLSGHRRADSTNYHPPDYRSLLNSQTGSTSQNQNRFDSRNVFGSRVNLPSTSAFAFGDQNPSEQLGAVGGAPEPQWDDEPVTGTENLFLLSTVAQMPKLPKFDFNVTPSDSNATQATSSLADQHRSDNVNEPGPSSSNQNSNLFAPMYGCIRRSKTKPTATSTSNRGNRSRAIAALNPGNMFADWGQHLLSSSPLSPTSPTSNNSVTSPNNSRVILPPLLPSASVAESSQSSTNSNRIKQENTTPERED